MCNILVLEEGQMIDKDKFWNMCYNNWHSWGLVTKIGDRFDIQRKVPESGEIDPQEVWDACQKDIQYQRFLHVRHTTAGVTDLDNCHPFDVYYDPKSGRQVLFMHNGTLHSFKSMKPSATGSSFIVDDSGPSDTKNFVDQVLIPYVAQADFGNGRGDITSSALKILLSKFWATQNRGILISSKDPFLLLGRGEWKEIKADDETSTVWSANDLYFDRVTRGPEFERRQEAEKVRLRLEEEAKQSSKEETEKTRITLTKVSDLDRRKGVDHPYFGLTESLSEILSDWDFYDEDRQGRAALAYATDKELEELHAQKDTCIWVMNYMFSDYATVVDELEQTEAAKKRGELVIAAQKKQIQELQEKLDALSDKKPAKVG